MRAIFGPIDVEGPAVSKISCSPSERRPRVTVSGCWVCAVSVGRPTELRRPILFDMEVIARRQDREHCASITRMIRHYVARRAQVSEAHPHNAAERSLRHRILVRWFSGCGGWGRLRACAVRGPGCIDAVVAEGFLDAPGGGGPDALVDGKCLP